LTLSSAALIFSVSFIKGVELKHLLVESWICFAASITGMLASFIWAAWVIEKSIKEDDAKKITFHRRGIIILNILSGLFYVIGLILSMFYVYHNFLRLQ
jgi:hypothetical protein